MTTPDRSPGWGWRRGTLSGALWARPARPPTLRGFAAGALALGLVIGGFERWRRGAAVEGVLLIVVGLGLWWWFQERSPGGGASPKLKPRPGGTRGASPKLKEVAHADEDPALVGRASLSAARGWLGGTLAAAAIGLAIWRVWALDVERPTDGDWLWYGAGVGLVVAAALAWAHWGRSLAQIERSGRPRPGDAPGPRGPGAPWARLEWGLLICALVVAAGTRLVNLDGQPFGVWYDEAANGLEALRVVREPNYRPIYTDGVNATGHYLWLIAGMFQAFGVSIAPLRAISAIMGVLTVLAAYWAGRELHSPTLGVLWAVLYAVARWSITFSRLGMYNAATPLFELLALALLARGLRRGSVADFVLAGVAIGLGLCFYSAYQLFIGVLGIALLAVAWQQRAQWRTIWAGALITGMAALIVIAPLLKFIWVKPDRYFSRVQTTALFSDKAPEERLPALLENARKHVAMFHLRGDPNGRHNLPGAPMLDWVTGGLMAVGMLMALRRGRDPRALLIPVWIGVGLLGGILSLDFEAPQSLRAIGAQPAALWAAALPLTRLVEEWRRGGGRHLPQGGLVAVTLLFAVPAGVANVQTYFVRQAQDFAAWNAHSTPETIAAQLLRDYTWPNEAGEGYEAAVIALYDGHPTVRFLAQGVTYRRVETNATLPLLQETHQGQLLILDVERRRLFEEAKRLYPQARFAEIRPPFAGPVAIYAAWLTQEDLASIQGLMATYTHGAQEVLRQDAVIAQRWPEDAPVGVPLRAMWEGVLAVRAYGPYQFFVQAPGAVRLQIGEATVLEGDGSAQEGVAGGVVLARGHHPLRLVVEGGEGEVRLAWQPPDGPPTTIPAWALYVPPVRNNGLLGEYYANGAWAGAPALAQIDPQLDIYFHVPMLPRPYTVTWRGKLAIPEAGSYGLGLQSIDESALWIDGQQVVAAMGRNEVARTTLDLAVGLHDVEVRFADRTNHTFIRLLWLPPGTGEPLRPIPADFLFPPQANYEAVDVGDLARFLLPPLTGNPAALQGPQPERQDPAQVTVMARGLAAPRGVAVIGDTVYVAESSRGQVVQLPRAGGEIVVVGDADDAWVEPFDLATLPRPDGGTQLLIHDAATGVMSAYDPQTAEFTLLPIPDTFLNRSRGIGVSPNGDIWIANTPGERVAVFDLAGNLLNQIVLPGGTGLTRPGGTRMQPVDVAVLPDNFQFGRGSAARGLYVTDVANHQLIRFSLAGVLLASQPIPVANSVDGAHLAVDEQGRLYMTEPETGRVVRLDARGGVGLGGMDRVWSVRTAETPDAKPIGIAVDEDGAVWVADSQGGTLLRLLPEEAP